MKSCTRCGEVKSFEEFGKNAKLPSGLMIYCRTCVSEKNKARRVADPEREREHCRKYVAAHKDARYAYVSAWKAAHPEHNREAQRRHNAKFPERKAARVAVQAEVRAGRLMRLPCSVCGKERSEAHHPDYALPLSVVWLCKKHHAEIHRNNQPLAQNSVKTLSK